MEIKNKEIKNLNEKNLISEILLKTNCKLNKPDKNIYTILSQVNIFFKKLFTKKNSREILKENFLFLIVLI